MKRNAFWIVLICCLLLYASAAAQTAYVDGKTASRVHLRYAASQDAESMGLFYTGTEVELSNGAALQNDWVRVNIGAMTGYIMDDYLSEERPQQAVMPVCRVKSGTLNLRSKPSQQPKVIRVLEEGEKLTLMGQTSNDWYYVLRADGTIGYVMPEYVELTGENASANNAEACKVGETFDGYGIYSWIAPNGQTLYFAALEDPLIKFEDVNFDGHEDVVIFIICGASSFFTEFFVWDDGQYVYARHPGLGYGICNYSLYPEYGIVHSNANNGSAGAEHEDVLLRWENDKLRVIRRAVSENATETTWFSDGGAYTVHTDLQNLRVRAWDYMLNVPEGQLIYETIISQQSLDSGDAYTRLFAGEQEALWRDIK